MSVYTLAERKLQHKYMKNDIEFIKSEPEKLTASTQTERCWLISYILKGKFSFTCGQQCSMHPLEQREVNCIHTNRKVYIAFILAERNTACIHKDRCWMLQHVQRKVNCLHINSEMLTVFLLAHRNTLHVHLRKDIECFNTYSEGITQSTKKERWCLTSSGKKCKHWERRSMHPPEQRDITESRQTERCCPYSYLPKETCSMHQLE